MAEISRFKVDWFCPCGNAHKTPVCQKCGNYDDGWMALKSGWRVSVKTFKVFVKDR